MSRVADLLMQQGAIAARARELSGQAWGNAVSNIAQIPAQLVAQHRQEQNDALQRRELQQRIDLQEQHKQSNDQAVKQQTALDRIWGSGVFKDDGSVDVSKAEALATQAGMAHLIPSIRDQANKWDTSAADLASKRENAKKSAIELAAAQRDQLGVDASDIQKLNYDQGTFQLFVAKRAKDGIIPPEQANSLLEQTAVNPARIKDVVDAWVAQSKTAQAIRMGGMKELPKDVTLIDVNQIGSDGKPKVVATGAPGPKHLEAKPDMVIQGTTNIPSFDPDSGKYFFDGKEVTAGQVVKAAPAKDPIAMALAQVALENARQNLTDKQRRVNDIKAIADGIKNGTIPPDPEGLTRNGLYGDVVAKLTTDGLNFNEMRQNYMAQKRLIQTENSPQGVRLDIAVRSGLKMYDKIDELSSQWDGMGLGILSRANLKLALEGAKGKAAQSLAVQLNGQIAQLTSDVATVEQNGMTPTQESRKVAEESMQSWWGDKTIKAMTAQGRANMRIRDMARKETVPLVPGTTDSNNAPTSATEPNMIGLAPGNKRTFDDGPFKGQTWTVIDGKPKRVS